MKKTILFLFACIITMTAQAQITETSILTEWEQLQQKEIEAREKAESRAKMGGGTTPEDAGLIVERGNDANQDGYVIFGNPLFEHISISNIDIQQKTSSGANYSTLYLNYYGGNVSIASGANGVPTSTNIGTISTNTGNLNAYNTLWAGGVDKRVGIGTTTPDAKLHIDILDDTETFLECEEGNTTVAKINGDGSAEFKSQVELDLTGSIGGGVRMVAGGSNLSEISNVLGGLSLMNYQTGATGDIVLGTQGQSRMWINEDGLVSINTNVQESDLHIDQSGGAASNQGTGGICLEDASTGNDHWRIYNSNPYIRFNHSSDFGATYTAKAYIDNNDGSWNQLSDRSLKSDIEDMNTVLKAVNELEVKKYHYNDNVDRTKKSIGFIAQEVDQLFPELVSSEEGETLKGINYAGFGVIAIKAIQEQQAIIEHQQSEIDELRSMISELQETKK